MANAVSCGVPQNKMGHLAHNWCSSYVKCRHNINRLQNTRLLCSTNSESDSCLWFWRFFHMRWIHTVHFACLVKMWCFSWLSVKWICWEAYIPFYSLSWLCLLLTAVSGNVTQFWVELEVGGLYHALELQSFAASVAPWEHITAPMRHWPQGTALAEKLWGWKEDVVHSANFASTVKLDAWGQSWNTEEMTCVVQLLTSGAVNTVTDTTFSIVLEAIIEKQCKVEKLFENELPYCWT